MKRASEASGFVSRAREGETPRETTDAASLAESLPGVHVRRLGADDGFATLSIRGSGSSQVAVVLAGVPLTGGSDPTLDLGSLPVWPGVSMRAYRTFAPGSLGPGSLGGSLALDPPTSIERKTDTYTSYGTYGAMRIRASHAEPIGEGRVIGAVSASRSDDGFTYFAPDGLGGGDTLRRENAGHAQASALVSTTQPIALASGKRGNVRLTLIGQSRRQQLPGTALDPTPFDRLDTTRLLPVLEVSMPAGRGTWRARMFGRRDDQSVRSPAATFAPPHENDVFVMAGGAVGWRGALSDLVRVDLQVDGNGERYAPGRYVGTTPEGARRASLGFAGDVDLAVSRVLTLSGTARVDTWSDEAASERAPSAEVRPTGHVGFEARAGDVTFASHAGATARPAAFVELYGNRGAFLPNPDLKTESATTVDAGVRVAPRWKRLRLDAGLSTFASFAEDLITFVPVGAFGRARAENIGRARIAGVEAEVEARLAPFALRVVYTLLDARNLGAGACGTVVGVCERPLLPGRPQHDLVTDFGVRLGPARVRYGVDYVSGIAADLQGNVVVPPRVLQSVGVRLDVPHAPGFVLAGEVRNLFDLRVVSYQGVRGDVLLPIGDAYAYPLPGRTAFVSLRFSSPPP